MNHGTIWQTYSESQFLIECRNEIIYKMVFDEDMDESMVVIIIFIA